MQIKAGHRIRRSKKQMQKNILYHIRHEVNIITCVFGDADGSGWQVHPTVYRFIHPLLLNKQFPPGL